MQILFAVVFLLLYLWNTFVSSSSALTDPIIVGVSFIPLVAATIFSILILIGKNNQLALLKSQLLGIRGVFGVTVAALAFFALFTDDKQSQPLAETYLVTLFGACLVNAIPFFVSSYVLHIEESSANTVHQ